MVSEAVLEQIKDTLEVLARSSVNVKHKRLAQEALRALEEDGGNDEDSD